MLRHSRPVDDAVQLHCSRPDVRRFADRHEGHEPPIRAARDPDLLRSDKAAGLQEFGSINLILQVTPTQILIVGSLKVDSISGRPADIGRDTDITTGYQCRHARTPIVLNLSRRASV